MGIAVVKLRRTFGRSNTQSRYHAQSLQIFEAKVIVNGEALFRALSCAQPNCPAHAALPATLVKMRS